MLEIKCHQNHSPVVCERYVKYEEAEDDGLVATFLKKYPRWRRTVRNKVSSPSWRGLLNEYNEKIL